MLNHLRISILTLLLLICAGLASAHKYSTATVTVGSGNGKVYVSASSTSSPAYGTGNTVSQDGNSDNHTYYLYAQPDDGFAFSHWTQDGEQINGGSTAEVSVATAGSESDQPKYNFAAHFIVRPGVMLDNPTPEYGTASITPFTNRIGDEVTLKASVPKIPAYQCKNLMVDFIGWQDDSDGSIISAEPEYKFTVEKDMSITAVFKNKSYFTKAGYYQVRNIFNRVLTIEGNWKYPLKLKDNYLDGLVRWSCPDDIDFADFQNAIFDGTDDKPGVDVCSLPATILYIVGASEANLDVAPGGTALSKVNVSGQGTDIKSMTGYTLSILKGDARVPGYFYFNGGATAGLKMTNRYIDNKRCCSGLLGTSKVDDAYSWMAVQPIDEEHFDEFWFGAHASAEMNFEGGNWTSMYTSFPYECRDGVEAYIIEEQEATVVNDVRYLTVSKIEDGIVPAETPVLLKCQGERSNENRLMPLLPDDSRVAGKAYTSNLLVGEYQLYTDANLNGLKDYDASTMRVLGVNNGVVGFYKLAPNEDGTPRKLAANKVYLDLSRLSSPASSYRIVSREMSGLEGITVDEPAAGTEDETVYDLTGRPVAHPQPNTIYIVGGRKILWR